LIVHDQEFFLLVLVLFTVSETVTELKVLHVEVSELFTQPGVFVVGNHPVVRGVLTCFDESFMTETGMHLLVLTIQHVFDEIWRVKEHKYVLTRSFHEVTIVLIGDSPGLNDLTDVSEFLDLTL
jgi:hypothetical protein